MSSSTSSKALVFESNATAKATLITPASKHDFYFTIPEVMALLHVSDRTLLRWRHSGILPAAKMGGTVLYSAKVVHGILANNIKRQYLFDDEL